MKLYDNLFMGYYCMVKSLLPNEDHPEAYATGFLSGAITLLYFAVTGFFLGLAGGWLETAGVFLVVYAAHHMLFVTNKKFARLEAAHSCTERGSGGSILFFFVCLALLMLTAEGVLHR